MPAVSHRPLRFRAIVFDLDQVLLARETAWRYAIEEAVIAVTGRRVDARALAAEYHLRPWRHALSILVSDAEEGARCETLCVEMFRRSAMKKLLVHEGIGMALDAVRGERVEMGAISREPHVVALRQVQSTGLDRFIAVLSATPEGQPWQPGERIADCLAFLQTEPARAAYVASDRFDLAEAARAGLVPVFAGWAGQPAVEGVRRLETPGALGRLAAEGG
ncbi:MAG: HAD hydrolase-like protein [Dehalococcoidia bacterium]|nr:HAD hydrolase-like protein [Dehalococcoidia bacterium]